MSSFYGGDNMSSPAKTTKASQYKKGFLR